MNWAAIIWLALMLGFILMESSTITLVSIWFAVGSLAALVTSLLGGEIWLQIVLFLAVSVTLLACLRPLLRKYFKPKVVPTNVDALIGSTGYVTADIENVSAQGQVKLGSMEWTARSSSGDPIPSGTLVRVDKVEGVKAFVSVVNVNTTV